VGSIYLIRHGQASFGADDYDVLSPVGVARRKSSVATWQTGPVRPLPAGDLRRQQHTATALEQHAPACRPGLETDPPSTNSTPTR
jgi:broad specificity phosphatase PhoE